MEEVIFFNSGYVRNGNIPSHSCLSPYFVWNVENDDTITSSKQSLYYSCIAYSVVHMQLFVPGNSILSGLFILGHCLCVILHLIILHAIGPFHLDTVAACLLYLFKQCSFMPGCDSTNMETGMVYYQPLFGKLCF